MKPTNATICLGLLQCLLGCCDLLAQLGILVFQPRASLILWLLKVWMKGINKKREKKKEKERENKPMDFFSSSSFVASWAVRISAWRREGGKKMNTEKNKQAISDACSKPSPRAQQRRQPCWSMCSSQVPAEGTKKRGASRGGKDCHVTITASVASALAPGLTVPDEATVGGEAARAGNGPLGSSCRSWPKRFQEMAARRSM
jgi:hypothetical protein